MIKNGQSLLAFLVLAGGLVAAGAIAATALAQSPRAAPLGASRNGDSWCMVVFRPDTTQFQEQVVGLVAEGGTVVASQYYRGPSDSAFYALVCRQAPTQVP